MADIQQMAPVMSDADRGRPYAAPGKGEPGGALRRADIRRPADALPAGVDVLRLVQAEP